MKSDNGFATDSEVRTFRQRLFDAHLEAEPEEGTTLGAAGCDARLRDYSAEGVQDELARHRATIGAVQQLQRGRLTGAERLDLEAIAGYARFRRHTLEDRGEHECNIEASVYAHAIAQYQVARATTEQQWVDVWRRTEQLPRALIQQEALLEQGRQNNRLPDRTVASFVVRQQLPAIAKFFATSLASLPGERGVRLEARVQEGLGAAALVAAAAYERHRAFLAERIVSGATDSWALGESEYRWRLSHAFGMSEEPGELLARAEEVVRNALTSLRMLGDELGAKVPASAAPVEVMRAASDRLRELEGDRPPEGHAVAHYESLLERLTAFIRGRGLFRIDAAARAQVVSMPAGMLHGASISNWPAPLLNPQGTGCVVLRPESECHPKVRSALLAAHEGIPGHFLQSVAWQRRFGRDAAPVRFLNTADDVAMLRQYYAPMLNIEGYATYAEDLLRVEGFYSKTEELFAVSCRAFRALRLALDVALHCRFMNPQEAGRYIVAHTSFSSETADAEILRYQRLPMQGATYLLGALQFEDLRREMRQKRGTSFRDDEFHEQLFSFGPVPPAVIRQEMQDLVLETQ